MKKSLILLFTVVVSIVLVSWGVTGHRTVGLIAENHLMPQAKATVIELLGRQNLADVSTYADEIGNDERYRYTKAWHYINVPLGLSYNDFRSYVGNDTEPNIYSNLLIKLNYLRNPATLKVSASKLKTVEADCLKWVVHLVGDLHQPMHISRAEDKGGNSIELVFNGSGTNLHALWDSKLIDRQGLDYKALAKKIDTVSTFNARHYSDEDIMHWLYESYSQAAVLYEEVETNKILDDNYYTAHIEIVNKRLETGGLRLAALLNEIFTNGYIDRLSAPKTVK